jgi:hypothetical protein
VKRWLLVIVAAVLGLAPGRALAQDEGQGPGREARRDEAFKMVDAYIVSQLQESLGLTDAQFAKALPLVKKLQTDRREYFLGRARLLREMRRMLRSGSATEAEVVAKLKELKALDDEGPAKTRKDLDALDAVLSEIQQAKYQVLELEVEQRMRELMSRARQDRPARRQQN